MQQRIDEAVMSLRKVLTFEDTQMQVFETASTRRFERQHIADIVSSVFGKNITTSAADVSSKTKNNMALFASDIDKSIDEQGETLWALFNAVTRYTNHTSVSRDKDYSLMFGSDAETNERAYQTLLSWINEPSLVVA
jgi:hypothetical protein